MKKLSKSKIPNDENNSNLINVKSINNRIEQESCIDTINLISIIK